MSNRTYVCLDCRTAMRAESAYGLKTDFRCRLCQGELFEVSHRWRIPKQNDDKEWDVLRQKVITDRNLYRSYHRANALRQLRAVDENIDAANKQKKDTVAKRNKLRRLQLEKKRLLKTYKGLIDDYESNIID